MGLVLKNVESDASVPDGEARGFRDDGVQVCVVRVAPRFSEETLASGDVARWVVNPEHRKRLYLMATWEIYGFPVEGSA